MNNDHISILPTYNEDGSCVVLVIDKLDGSLLSEDDLADCLETYVALLRVPSGDPDRAN